MICLFKADIVQIHEINQQKDASQSKFRFHLAIDRAFAYKINIL